MFYRGAKMTKHIMIAWYRRIFDMHDLGKLNFYDGTREIQFSKKPKVMETGQWDRSEKPVVLVESAAGPMEWMDFGDEVGKEEYVENGVPMVRPVLGGFILLDLAFKCIAASKEERDDLVDTVALYMSMPDVREFLMTHYIVLYTKPTFTGEGRLNALTDERDQWEAGLKVSVRTQWEEKGTGKPALEGFLVDPLFQVDLTL